MANITYDLQWRECMTDILDQIEAEDPEDEALRPDAEADFFQHFAWSGSARAACHSAACARRCFST